MNVKWIVDFNKKEKKEKKNTKHYTLYVKVLDDYRLDSVLK